MLKERLQPLGLDPLSDNYGCIQEPDKEKLISTLLEFQRSLDLPIQTMAKTVIDSIAELKGRSARNIRFGGTHITTHGDIHAARDVNQGVNFGGNFNAKYQAVGPYAKVEGFKLNTNN